MTGDPTMDPATRAYIHILRGLHYDLGSIAEIIDCNRKTVSHCLNRTHDRVEAGEDPINVWVEITTPLYENDPDSGGDE
jgi:predicted DNA-binding protein YlxM (UPF0122 family)